VGNGVPDEVNGCNRSNALTLMKNGNLLVAGKIFTGVSDPYSVSVVGKRLEPVAVEEVEQETAELAKTLNVVEKMVWWYFLCSLFLLTTA
jgi:hypothetical protein